MPPDQTRLRHPRAIQPLHTPKAAHQPPGRNGFSLPGGRLRMLFRVSKSFQRNTGCLLFSFFTTAAAGRKFAAVGQPQGDFKNL